MFKVIFRSDDGTQVIAFAQEGDNLLEIARSNNVAIDAPCSGNAVCGKCRVRLLEGELQSAKTAHISEEEYAQGWRLSCVSRICADVTVLVPDIASAYKSSLKVADLGSEEERAIFRKLREDIVSSGISFTNDLELVDLHPDPPSLDDTMPDNERLVRAVSAQTGAENVHYTFPVLRSMSKMLRDNDFHVKAVISKKDDEAQILHLLPGNSTHGIYGLAVDIGTTTVAALLVDMKTGEITAKASSGNGQIRYGADVINRIIESVKDGGSKKLQDAIIGETLNPMIDNMCAFAHIEREEICRCSIAGNTTMNHLLMGVYADPVRMEPYIPTFFEASGVKAGDLGLHMNPCARLIIAPNIGSYVGGDITAGTFASGIWHRPQMSLFIDLGTNGELVLGNEEFMMSCACSAGPAFEGGDISCGMRAADGAIEKCTIDKETMEPTFSVIGPKGRRSAGICGSGIIDLIAELFRCGIINPKGKFIREGKRIRHDKYGMGSYVLSFAEDSASVKDIEINEVDIDNFIRAKGAIFSAVRVMLGSLGLTVDVIDDVYVAGGIGSGINMKNAVYIGMLPDIPLEKYHYIGNSSLAGAYSMLLSNEAEEKVAAVAGNMTYMELSSEPSYMDEFVACCFIPHTDTSLFPSFKA